MLLTLLALGFAVFILMPALRGNAKGREKTARLIAFVAWCTYAAYEGIYIHEWLASVRGAPIRADLLPIGVVLAIATTKALWPNEEPHDRAATERPAHMPGNRVCHECGHIGPMKTWLRNYNAPQLAILGLLSLFLVPGILFIAWAWGKCKCPKCGAVGKNSAA